MSATSCSMIVGDDPLEGDLDGLVARVRAEYVEMPGLRVTEPQARRLWSLEAPTCRWVLSRLQDAGFLRRLRDGTFIRADVY